MKDFVPMKLVPGEKIIHFDLGQMIPVFIEFEEDEMKVMMKVIKIYPDGNFDGEVDWEEA